MERGDVPMSVSTHTIALRSKFPSGPFTATPFSVTIAVISSAGVTSKLGLYTPSKPSGVIITAACCLFPSASSEGGYSAPRTMQASNGGRCSMGMLRIGKFRLRHWK